MNMNENRASQLESMLQNLPEAAEQGLAGLKATPALKARIQLAAAQQKPSTTRIPMNTVMRWASAACCALLVLVLGVSLISQQQTPAQPTSLITSGALGDGTTQAPPITGDLDGSGRVDGI